MLGCSITVWLLKIEHFVCACYVVFHLSRPGGCWWRPDYANCPFLRSVVTGFGPGQGIEKKGSASASMKYKMYLDTCVSFLYFSRSLTLTKTEAHKSC